MAPLARTARSGFLASVKVFRDHVQVVGMMLNGLGKTIAAKLSLRTIAPAIFAVSLDFGSLGVNPAKYFEATFIVLIIAVVFALCGFRVFLKMKAPDVIREGHEVELWDKRKENKKWVIGAVQLFFRMLAAAYIELVRQIVMVFSCAEDFRDGLYDAEKRVMKPRDYYNCEDSEEYDTYIFLAVVMLLIFGIGSPMAMAWAIRKNKPTGLPEDPDKRYDRQGNLVDYTDEMYRRDLAREDQQACPYVFLYDDYKRTRSYYELEMMLFKSALAICGVLLMENLIALGIVNLILVLLVGYIAYKDAPFLDPMVSAACFAGHLAEIVVQALLVVSAAVFKDEDTGNSAGSDVLASAVFIAAAVGWIVNIFVALITNNTTRPYVNSFLGRLTFSSVVTTSVGTARVMLAAWDPVEEARQRAWKSFWDTLVFEQLGEDGMKRLREQDNLALKLGVQRLHDSVEGSADKQVMAIRASVLSIEGVDVYWRYDTERLCSFFGKMYVVPSPFHAVVVFDDTDDYVFIHEPRVLNELASVNLTDQEVLIKKDSREKMRGMWGKRVQYAYDHWVTKRVADGHSVYKDSKGNEHRRTEYSSIQVHIFYKSGVFRIGRKFQSNWSYGFDPSVHLDDGEGSARKPRTGEMAHFKNETYTVSASELGVDHTMDRTKFAKLFNENQSNLDAWQQEWLGQVATYRKCLATERHERNCILRDEFWYAIYNEPLPSAQMLRQRIVRFEKNPKITRVALEPDEKFNLDQLCADIMRFEDPKEAFWFTFWHDVWQCNSDIKPIGNNPEIFDPAFRDSLAHRLLSRSELESNLADCLGARKANKLFSSLLLDLLYDHMCEHADGEDAGRRSSAANRGFYIKGVDDADSLPDIEQPHDVESVESAEASVAVPSPETPATVPEVGAVEEKQVDDDDATPLPPKS